MNPASCSHPAESSDPSDFTSCSCFSFFFENSFYLSRFVCFPSFSLIRFSVLLPLVLLVSSDLIPHLQHSIPTCYLKLSADLLKIVRMIVSVVSLALWPSLFSKLLQLILRFFSSVEYLPLNRVVVQNLKATWSVYCWKLMMKSHYQFTKAFAAHLSTQLLNKSTLS